jgi:hypothetical protein
MYLRFRKKEGYKQIKETIIGRKIARDISGSIEVNKI